MAAPVQGNSPWLPPVSPDFAVPAGMCGERFHAMGTTVSLLLPSHAAAVGSIVARNLFATWEDTLSRFRPESELSALNGRPGIPVTVGPLLWDMLVTALDAARATDGLFDPSMHRQIRQLGYDRSFEQLGGSSVEATGAVPSGGGWRGIRLDAERRQVTLPVGVGIDLGGIAKGLAVDATLARLRQLGVVPALVNAGGDLAVIGAPPAAETWPIAVPGRDGSWILPLGRGAMATSGRAKRRWRQGDRERHHLLDPRTGEPADTSLWSVTVVAATCAQAEVAAKSAFIAGPDAGAAFLEQQELAGLFVDESGAWLTAGPWPAAVMTEMWGGAP